MTKHIREMVAASGIENVSRRGVLKGILSTTGLVLVVHVTSSGPAIAADAPEVGRGRHAARHSQQSPGVRFDRA